MELKKSIKLITKILWQIKNKEDFEYSLEDLMTPAELIDLGDRIALLKMLKKGFSQREISKKLGISITTVSRGSRLLKYQQKVIKKYL